MKYRLSWKDEDGSKKFTIFDAKTDKAAKNKTNKLLGGIKFTDPFLGLESEINKGYKGEENMKGKWMYELCDREIWSGEEFDTKEEAITAGKDDLILLNKARKENGDKTIKSFQVGQIKEVAPCGVDVDFILENVAENTAQGMEVGEDYLCDVTDEHSAELEQKLNDVLFAWMKEHG